MRSSATRLLSGLVVVAVLLCARTALADAATGYRESGQASWYGPRHEGRRTTSGERFDSTKLTAAHSSLPMGSLVRVTVQQTGRSIVVRVNDREPPHGVRCIDLSRAAALRLGIVTRGIADVTLAQIDPADATELAEAPENAVPEDAVPPSAPRPTVRHGRRHTRRGHR